MSRHEQEAPCALPLARALRVVGFGFGAAQLNLKLVAAPAVIGAALAAMGDAATTTGRNP